MRGKNKKTLQQYIEQYHSSKKENNSLWKEFTCLTNSIPYLQKHRDWVEKHSWGFGDRAFHYMWYLLLAEDVLKRSAPFLLEIGVYKGQTISLWSLIAEKEVSQPNIYAISPFSGTRPRLPQFLHKLWLVINKEYRENIRSGNFYNEEDYLTQVEKIFNWFNLDITSIYFLRGYSQDNAIKAKMSDRTFDLVYIDGGHRYEEVSSDTKFYGDKVRVGGYLVLDDAMYFQPGTLFWKGHKSVSRAAEEIDKKRFVNILNVGHNRIYKRLF